MMPVRSMGELQPQSRNTRSSPTFGVSMPIRFLKGGLLS